jgi:hypothetical protein
VQQTSRVGIQGIGTTIVDRIRPDVNQPDQGGAPQCPRRLACSDERLRPNKTYERRAAFDRRIAAAMLWLR